MCFRFRKYEGNWIILSLQDPSEFACCKKVIEGLVGVAKTSQIRHLSDSLLDIEWKRIFITMATRDLHHSDYPRRGRVCASLYTNTGKKIVYTLLQPVLRRDANWPLVFRNGTLGRTKLISSNINRAVTDIAWRCNIIDHVIGRSRWYAIRRDFTKSKRYYTDRLYNLRKQLIPRHERPFAACEKVMTAIFSWK